MRFLFPFVALAILASGRVQAQTIHVAPVPNWVTPVTFSELPGDSAAVSGGYYYLLSEDQYNLTSRQSFHRYVQLITSEKGMGKCFHPLSKPSILHIRKSLFTAFVLPETAKSSIN